MRAFLALGSPPDQPLLFKDFPAGPIYRGALHSPELDADEPPETPKNWAITQGARTPADFAGHYRVVKFSCGTECTGYSINDVVSGRRIGEGSADFPYAVGPSKRAELPRGLSFRSDSRLFVVQGCLISKPCGSYFYELQNDKLVLKKVIEFAPQPTRNR